MSNRKSPTYDKYTVPAVDQAGRILLYMAENEARNMSLIEICQHVDIYKGKAFCILKTLEDLGFVKKNPNKKGYTLGLNIIKLSNKLLDNLNIPRIAEPILSDLANKTNATVILGLISDKMAFVIEEYKKSREIGISLGVGNYFPIMYGAHGKAIVSFLPEQDLNNLLTNDKPYFYGDPEKFDRARLQEEIVRCRLDGFAMDLGEVKPGLNTVAAPLLTLNNKPLGYIMAGLFTKEQASDIAPLIAQAGRTISRELGATI